MHLEKVFKNKTIKITSANGSGIYTTICHNASYIQFS